MKKEQLDRERLGEIIIIGITLAIIVMAVGSGNGLAATQYPSYDNTFITYTPLVTPVRNERGD
ncbi:MAG: hypothetical protein AB1847_20905, partial [bacterium]